MIYHGLYFILFVKKKSSCLFLIEISYDQRIISYYVFALKKKGFDHQVDKDMIEWYISSLYLLENLKYCSRSSNIYFDILWFKFALEVAILITYIFEHTISLYHVFHGWTK